MRKHSFASIFLLAFIVAQGHASVDGKKSKLPDRLAKLRTEVISLQEGLIDSIRSQRTAKENIKKIQTLIKLQKEEKELGKIRLIELEQTIGELEARRGILRERILVHRKQIRKALIDLKASLKEEPKGVYLPSSEKLEAPRRKVLANLAERGLKEIEAYKVDLDDADKLQARIQEEEHHLAYVFQDLKEQESVLELNRQLQIDIIKKKRAERIAQLESYRKLKSAEAEVEKLIGDFNARLELEHAVETERAVSRSMMQGAFGKVKGRLSMPVPGSVVSNFGRSFDQKSNLHIFKKGIEIAAAKNYSVKAIFSGRVAYSGTLPNYGQITIIDHGDHFYSLCGKLGKLTKKEGDPVKAGDAIGFVDDAGTPIYFEIRARNIAVNPLQWVSN